MPTDEEYPGGFLAASRGSQGSCVENNAPGPLRRAAWWRVTGSEPLCGEPASMIGTKLARGSSPSCRGIAPTRGPTGACFGWSAQTAAPHSERRVRRSTSRARKARGSSGPALPAPHTAPLVFADSWLHRPVHPRMRPSEAQRARLSHGAILIMNATIAVRPTTLERALQARFNHRDSVATHARLGHPQHDRAQRRVLGL